MIPVAAIESAIDILDGEGATKHGDEWKTRADEIDKDAALRHINRHMDGNTTDPETGDLHIDYAVGRLLLMASRARL